jgi:hypothetical protein
MSNLRDALIGTRDPKPISYELRFTDAITKDQSWVSYSGPYDVDDRLSTAYGDWRVFQIERREPESDILTCEPFRGNDVQMVEFSMQPQVPATSVTPRDARRLVEEVRRQDADAAVAVRIEAAMQPGSSARVELAIGEDEAVLAALDRLEQTGDFLNALQRLQRDLRAKIDAEP